MNKTIIIKDKLKIGEEVEERGVIRNYQEEPIIEIMGWFQNDIKI